ncbi:MAG: hypothetical protein ABDH49_05325 [Candidatus Hydrothermales bacterium]
MISAYINLEKIKKLVLSLLLFSAFSLIFFKNQINFILFPLFLFFKGFSLIYPLLKGEDALTIFLFSYTFGYSIYVLIVSFFISKFFLSLSISNYIFILLSSISAFLIFSITNITEFFLKKIELKISNKFFFLIISLLFVLFAYILFEMSSIRDEILHYSYAYHIINGGDIYTFPLFQFKKIFYHFYSDVLLAGYSFFTGLEAWESSLIFATIHFFPFVILLYKFFSKFTSHIGSPLYIFLFSILLSSSRWLHTLLHFLKNNRLENIVEMFLYGKYTYSTLTPSYSIFYYLFHTPTFVGLPSLLLIFFILFNQKGNFCIYRGLVIGTILGFLSFCNFAYFPIVTLPLFIIFIKKEYRKVIFYSFLTMLVLLILNDYIYNSIKLSSAIPGIRVRLFAQTLLHSPSLVFFEYFFVTFVLFLGFYFYLKKSKFVDSDLVLFVFSLTGAIFPHILSYGETPFTHRYASLIGLFGTPFIYLTFEKIKEIKNRTLSLVFLVALSFLIFLESILNIRFYSYAATGEWKFKLSDCQIEAINFIRKNFSDKREKIKIFEKEKDGFMIFSGFCVEGSSRYNRYLKIILPLSDTTKYKKWLDSLDIVGLKKENFLLIVVTKEFRKKASRYTLDLIENKNFFEKIFECDEIEIFRIIN